MYYAVIDTNVLVSAMLKAHSNPGEVIKETLMGKIIPLINQDILDEYNEVLRRKKFKFQEEHIMAVVDGIKNRAVWIDAENIEEILPDPKDIVFYAVVEGARRDTDAYLVTGNIKHFPVKYYVVTPTEMLEIIELSGILAEADEDVKYGRVAPVKDTFDDLRRELTNSRSDRLE